MSRLLAGTASRLIWFADCPNHSALRKLLREVADEIDPKAMLPVVDAIDPSLQARSRLARGTLPLGLFSSSGRAGSGRRRSRSLGSFSAGARSMATRWTPSGQARDSPARANGPRQRRVVGPGPLMADLARSRCRRRPPTVRVADLRLSPQLPFSRGGRGLSPPDGRDRPGWRPPFLPGA